MKTQTLVLLLLFFHSQSSTVRMFPVFHCKIHLCNAPLLFVIVTIPWWLWSWVGFWLFCSVELVGSYLRMPLWVLESLSRTLASSTDQLWVEIDLLGCSPRIGYHWFVAYWAEGSRSSDMDAPMLEVLVVVSCQMAL